MQATGTLTVRVYTSQARIPIPGATVAVTAPGQGGRMRLVSIQATDSSGAIRTVRMDTPEAAESTAPQPAEGAAPFALCDVWAEHPGYALMRMEGVQVFPGVETIQDVEMLPLAQGESSFQHRDVREIPPQNL